MGNTDITRSKLEGGLQSQSERTADPGSAADQPTDEKKSLMVRIDPKAKAVLERAANNEITGPATYASVIEALLDYYDKQSPDLKEKILLGMNINPLSARESENLLARLHRAEHAVVNKRYYFAVRTYKAIAAQLHNRDSSKELLEVCNYRLGHCWLRLSYGLRVLALSDHLGREDLRTRKQSFFGTAQDALGKALEYLTLLEDDSDPLMTLIKHYNMACCYSLKAQYLVEANLEPESRFRSALRETRKDPQQTQNVWEHIGETWRGKKEVEDLVNPEAKKSLNELHTIYSLDHQSAQSSLNKADPISERLWCVEMAAEDSDLLFMRHDTKQWKIEFDKWKTHALQDETLIGKAI